MKKNGKMNEGTSGSVLTIQGLSDAILQDYRELKNWRKVGVKWGINEGTAYDIGVYRYEPKRPGLRCKLGLPALVPTSPCPIHGVVHVRKTCPKPKKEARLWDLPVRVLRWKLENREEDHPTTAV